MRPAGLRRPAEAAGTADVPAMAEPDSLSGPAGASRRRDFRLVPAAVTVWVSALLGLLCGWLWAVVVGLVAVLVATGLVWHSIRAPAISKRARLGSAGALFVCGLVAIAMIGPQLLGVEHDPLRSAASLGKTAVLRVSIMDVPRPVHSAGYAGQPEGARSVVLGAEVQSATIAGKPVHSRGRILLIAPVEAWSAALPGQLATATVKLAPAGAGEFNAAVGFVRGQPKHSAAAPWWQRFAESMRSALRSACGVLADEPAGLLPGLVVGDVSGLSSRVRQEFLDSGMSHLTAVSGSNVVIVCGAVLLMLRLLRCGPRLSALSAGFALIAFLILVGPEPSVLRAGVMGGIGLFALALGRAGSALSSLSIAVCALVLHDPSMSTSFGFALSVVATASLVLFAPRLAHGLVRRGIPIGFAEGLTVPLAAFVATAPIIAGMAGKISLVSVIANVLVAPVIAPVTIFGVLASVAAPVWPGLAEFFVHLAGPEVDWLIFVAREAADVPGAVVNWPSGWLGGLLAAVSVAVVVLMLRYRKWRVVLAVLVVATLLVVVPTRVVSPAWPPENWTMVTCDVGQGDSLVLSTGEPGRAVVVDTGPEPGPVDDCLDRLGVERVPLVVLSHLHADHIGGLAAVFEGRSVGAVAVGPGRTPGWAWRNVSNEAKAHGVPLLEFDVGAKVNWPKLSMHVLGPRYVPENQANAQDGSSINNSSVVLGAQTAAGRALLTGDVELAAQGDLLAAGTDLHADILKVPHHGSRYSLPQFLDAVSPRLALVSVGAENRYGHPSAWTLNALAGEGAVVARTDTDGDAAVIADSEGPSVVRRGRTRH